MSLDLVTMLDASDTPISFAVQTLVGGGKVAAHLFVDQNGNPVGVPANPFLTAPGIVAAAGAQRSGSVTVAGAAALTIAPNTGRKGGWIRAKGGNGGALTLTVTNADGSSFTTALAAGDDFTFSVSPGFILTGQVVIAGDTPGDTWEGVEFS